MSETKSHQFRPPLYREEPTIQGRSTDREVNGNRQREQQGWDAYRKWLSSMNGKPQSRRAPVDHSVYSWKGYNSWANRVRQSWKSDES